MANELDPLIDQWYQHRDKGELLRVVAVDRPGDVIEIQYFDGNVEELDFDTWRDMDIDLAEEPEDWTGPYDDIEADDLDATDSSLAQPDWRSPLDTLRSDTESWQDDRPLDEREEEEEGRPVESYLIEEESNQK